MSRNAMKNARQSIVAAIAASIISGCGEERGTMSDSQIESWIPVAASAAMPGALGSLPTSATAPPTLSNGLLIGLPTAVHRSRWTMWLPSSSVSISQRVVVKTLDGRFFSATYVWKEDPIIVDCRRELARCASFEGQRQIPSEAIMETLLSANVSAATAKAFIVDGVAKPAR